MQERLDDIRMLKFRVKWHNSGMNPEVPEHAQFVEDLCAQISPLLISIIDGIIEEDETKVSDKSFLRKGTIFLFSFLFSSIENEYSRI